MQVTIATIRRHNLCQVVLGLLGFVGAAVSSVVMFGLFWFAWWFFTGMSGLDLDAYQHWAAPFGWIMVGIIWLLGLLRYRQGLGSIDYWDSVDTLLPRGDATGAVVVDYYASRVTAPAVVFSNLFVAAPRWLLEGAKRFKRLVRCSPDRAQKLETLRRTLDEVRRWRPLVDYAGTIQDVQALHWMGIAAVGLRDGIPSVRISLEHQNSRDVSPA